MKIELPAGVARLLISDGRVFASMKPELLAQNVGLAVGSAQSLFEALDETAAETLVLTIEQRPDFVPKKLIPAAAAANCEALLNGLADWALAGRDTLQLRVTGKSGCQLEILAPILIPPHRHPLAFRAALASHRSRGRLLAVLTEDEENGDSRKQREFEVDFDPLKTGGTAPQSYQDVEFALAPSDRPTALTLTVAHDGKLDETETLDPYYFIADPHVGRKTAVQTVTEELGQARIAAPLIWAGADMPALLETGKKLDFVAGRRKIPIKSARNDTVTLLEDWGHKLVMQATTPGFYQVWVDSGLSFSAYLGTDPTPILFPAAVQDGLHHRVSIWDNAGSQRFYSNYFLLPRLMTPIEALQREGRAPFPATSMPQSEFRYAGLKAQAAAGRSPEDMAQVVRALAALEGDRESIRLAPLHFAEVEAPEVSIVIPAHNKVDVTYLALCSLLLAHNRASFEVIVVDDGSTDETRRLEEIVSGITVVRNERPLRFIGACNLGVARARGRYVALLNNDVEVTNGWLDALVEAFGRFDRVGLVGAKLLYPDGRLQDAGGIVWGSGNPWNYGQGESPWDPRFCYARQVDYLSGAALMTSARIWDEVGGLSSYLEPMYFEDTDLAFKIRDAGYRTWFVPAAVVFHDEGTTSGRDLATGFKRYQEINRPKFKRRWSQAFVGGGRDGEAVDLEKDRGIVGRILVIDHSVPRPDRDAGSYAAIQEIRLLQSLGYKITFLPSNMAHLGQYTENLQRMGVEVIHSPFCLSPEAFFEARGVEFDAAYITRYNVAEAVIDRIRQAMPQAPILLNNADLHFLRELRAGLVAGDPDKVEAARATRSAELAVMRKVDLVLSYSDVEHSVIESHTDGAVRVMKCPWVVDLPENVAPLDTRHGLSFLGNYQHPPNVEAVEWFVRHVVPRFEAGNRDMVFSIYGSAMTDAIRALAGDQVKPKGFVETVSEAYDGHRVFVAPLLSGAGIKGKVLAALARGVPCVLSPLAAEGIGLRHGFDCMIAATPEQWASAISALTVDDDLWTKLSNNARDYVRDSYSFEKGRAQIRAAMETIGLYAGLP